MKISLIASTHPGYKADKKEFDMFSGKTAGVCYMASNFNELVNEDENKTIRRINQTKGSGHHSVYDHESLTVYLQDIPKALAMVLNNEKMYTTSEKSARYTKMIIEGETQKLYDKWLEIFKKEITNTYKKESPEYFTDAKIEKLAQENARYLISVFTPTSMVYTTSYRQLNYIYSFMKKEIENTNSNIFYEKLKPAMQDFCECIEKEIPYLDEKLQNDGKNRGLSFMSDKKIEEYFGDVYSVNYKGSFAQLAQAHRHRTISYNMNLLESSLFYIPPIIKDNLDLSEDWVKDCESQKEQLPQGLLVDINEMGTLDNFILKMLERKCTFAQLEINQQTDATLNKYTAALKAKKHARAEELEKYTKGSRCTFPNYKCSGACGFKEGVTGERKI